MSRVEFTGKKNREAEEWLRTVDWRNLGKYDIGSFDFDYRHGVPVNYEALIVEAREQADEAWEKPGLYVIEDSGACLLCVVLCRELWQLEGAAARVQNWRDTKGGPVSQDMCIYTLGSYVDGDGACAANILEAIDDELSERGLLDPGVLIDASNNNTWGVED